MLDEIHEITAAPILILIQFHATTSEACLADRLALSKHLDKEPREGRLRQPANPLV